ncbi:MAG: MFS transporter, partial [Desulfobulbaceae bacterium]|nr:MFS transporter [Desulfobulbaceae bacterium]
GRGIQGVGAAMLAASFGAIILTYVPREKTGSVIGAVMMVMSLGILIGPPLGGFLAEHVSWHWVFLINLPITAISIGIICKYLVNNREEYSRDNLQEALKSLDIKGAVFSIIMLIALPAIFTLGSDKGWDSQYFLGTVIIFLVSGSLFAWTENSVANPLIQLSIFKNAGLVLILFIKGLVFIVMNGVMLVFPFFITGSSDMTIAQAGMFLLISAVAMAVTTPIAGKMTDRFQEIHLVLIAAFVLFLVIIGAFCIGAVPSKIIMGVVLAGFGGAMAVLMVATSVLILKQAPAGQEGIFSALNSLVLPVAGSVGVALFASIYAHGESVGSKGQEAYSGFILSMQSILVCILLLFVAAIFYTLMNQRKQKSVTLDV